MGINYILKRGTDSHYPITEAYLNGKLLGYYINEGKRSITVKPFKFVSRCNLPCFECKTKKGVKARLNDLVAAGNVF